LKIKFSNEQSFCSVSWRRHDVTRQHWTTSHDAGRCAWLWRQR